MSGQVGQAQGPSTAAATSLGLTVPLLVVALCCIWGFTYVALKIGQRWTGPWTMSGVRALIAGLAFVLLAWGLGRAWPRWGLHPKMALIGWLNVSGLAGCMSFGLTQVGAGEAALIIYSQPLLVALLAVPFLGERLSRVQLIGLALGFCGVVVVLAPPLQPGGGGWWAYAALFAGATSWAVSAVLARRWRQGGAGSLGEVDIVWFTGLQALYGALPLLAIALVVEGLQATPTLELAWTLAFTGLLSTGLANMLWFDLLRRRTAAMAAAPVFLVPAFATAFGALVLGEAIGPSMIVGGLTIIVGIALATRSPKPI